ncbi:MAG: hypothetical protein ACLPKZ_07740, partial [Acidimicrobiales bacterium]
MQPEPVSLGPLLGKAFLNVIKVGVNSFVIATIYRIYPKSFDLSYRIYDYTLSGGSVLLVIGKIF